MNRPHMMFGAARPPLTEAPAHTLVAQNHRHLQWPALDWLEAALMALCGMCLFMLTLSVACDVVSRLLGTPWRWFAQITSGFFIWGVFAGMAAATRRHDHFSVTEISKRLRGTPRLVVETLNRIVVLVVALLMAWFGWKNAILDLGSYRQPSLIPLAVYSGAIPFAGVLIALFSIEQLVNGWRHGFESAADSQDLLQDAGP